MPLLASSDDDDGESVFVGELQEVVDADAAAPVLGVIGRHTRWCPRRRGVAVSLEVDEPGSLGELRVGCLLVLGTNLWCFCLWCRRW